MSGDKIYSVGNFVRPSTAAPVPRATGTAIRTLLQLATSTTNSIKIVEWGISFNGSAAAVPGNVELFGCTGAASGLTALAATDVMRMSEPEAVATIAPLQYGVALTGYAPGAAITEGTVANYNAFDNQFIAPTSQYVKQFPLGREPQVAPSQFLRVRVTFPVTVDCLVYINFIDA